MQIGDRVRITKDSTEYEGKLMPTTTEQVVVKLDNGYNIGFRRKEILISIIEEAGPKQIEHTKKPFKEGLPRVSILSTGGTIASKVDYRTGAVTSQFTAEDILRSIPELSEIANYDSEVVYSILSENMQAEYWLDLARKVARDIESGADGIIITHGTDTMAYTASALSFMVKTPVPIVMVGSQRSADRPSSDSAMNAICAATVATSDIAEVTVVMHGSTSDDICHIHRGTKVRKMHTSARDAFKTIGADPIGEVDYLTRNIRTKGEYRRRRNQDLELCDHLESKCALIKFYPGSDPKILDFYLEEGYKGLVIEGTGLGHVSTEWFNHIKRVIDEGLSVVTTSQCIYGRVCDRVYDTGRDMLRTGVIEGEDMLPETALVKLMWVLGRTTEPNEVKSIMQKNVAGEIIPSIN
ncbi:MAG: Glu-tRNA(Gln) amidotransferase subunit GatD [Halobacteriota archaeon]|nr:Glu-tRNA(Gln) amidotransferase subunit GatD [Halobacteriota archaeon]